MVQIYIMRLKNIENATTSINDISSKPIIRIFVLHRFISTSSGSFRQFSPCMVFQMPSYQRSCRSIHGIQNIDDELGKRLQTLLDVLANVSICQHGIVSATMASLIRDGGSGTLKTRLYIIFNYENE